MQVPGAVLITMFCTVLLPQVHSCSALFDTGSLYCAASEHTTRVSPTGQAPGEAPLRPGCRQEEQLECQRACPSTCAKTKEQETRLICREAGLQLVWLARCTCRARWRERLQHRCVIPYRFC